MAASQNNYLAEVLTAGELYLVGFTEACKLYRVGLFFRKSRHVLKRTGQSFLLNGFLFLGSIFILRHVIIPVLHYFLGHPVPSAEGQIGGLGQEERKAARVLQNVILGAFYVLWLYPLYILSSIVNIFWYNDIAKKAFQAFQGMDKSAVESQKAPEVQSPSGKKEKESIKGKPANSNQDGGGLESALLQIGEQIYSVIMVSVFFLQVLAVSYAPYLGPFGPILNFVLLSWLYAYYCFDYKWGFSGWRLEKRILFFETNWAFFAGFGSPCVLATFFLSPLMGAGVMNVLFPLFVLVATASNPEEVVENWSGMHGSKGIRRRLPIFYLASKVTVPLLGLFQPGDSRTPSAFQKKKRES